MTRRFKLFLLPMAIFLVIFSGSMKMFYIHTENKAYNLYSQSESCRMLPSLVIELGYKDAVSLEAFRHTDQDAFFYFQDAEWKGTKSAIQDCVDMEG